MIILPRPLRERMVLPASMRRQRGFIIDPYRFSPTATWRTAFSRGAGIANGNFNGYTVRNVIGTSLLAGSASKARFTFRSATSGGCTITKAYVQIAASAGDAYDFDSAPVQITFGGATSYVIPLNSTVTSDDIVIGMDGTRNLVVSVFMGSLSFVRQYNGISGLTNYYRLGDEAATVNATSGYTSTILGVLNVLELFG